MTKTNGIPSDRVLLGFICGVLNFWLFALSLNGIIDKLVSDMSLNITKESLQSGIGLTALFAGCFIVVTGGIGDKIGYLKITYIGFFLSIVGSLLLIFASNSQMYITARILQGLSAAAIMSSTLALVKGYYVEPKQRQRALSLWSLGSWGGTGFATLFGDIVASNWDWRMIYVASAVVSVIGLLLITGAPEVKNNNNKKFTFDFSGLLFFLIALITLNLFITNVRKWTTPVLLISIAVVVVATIIFIIIQKKKKEEAFIDLVLFKNKKFNGATLSNFLLNATLGVISIIPLYVRDGLEFKYYGWLSIGYAFTILSTIRVGELILRKVGAKKPMILGIFVTLLAIILAASTFLPDNIYLIAVVVAFILSGLGLGLYATPSTDTAIANSPDGKAGVGSGVYKMASSLGGAFGVVTTLSVYYSLLPATDATIDDIAYASMIALLVNGVFCVLAIMSIMFFIRDEHKKVS